MANEDEIEASSSILIGKSGRRRKSQGFGAADDASTGTTASGRKGGKPKKKKKKRGSSIISTVSPPGTSNNNVAGGGASSNQKSDLAASFENTSATEASKSSGSKRRRSSITAEAVEESSEHKRPSSSSPPSSSKSSTNDKHDYSNIEYAIVQNTPDSTPTNLVRLIGLKSLFAKQLPKMPKEYIARLVFDRRHKSLALLSDDPSCKGGDEEIIGGICYRAYPEMRFAEIAFCAVSASQQVKGYGTKLMNLVKRHAVTEGIEYFITYADNYAIGYFKKQGFSKTISMPKGRFHGLIKDYDGGTIMECYIHPSIDYTRIPEMLRIQREFLLDRIRLTAKSHTEEGKYPPLDYKKFREEMDVKLEGVKKGEEAAHRAMAIPGVKEAGWTFNDLMASTGGQKDVDRQKNHMKSEMLTIIRKTEEQAFSWPFREPVDTSEVKDYLEIIKDPIDLSTIERRIRKGDWYKNMQMLQVDMLRMVKNCKMYNDSTSPYYDCAVALEKYLVALFT